MTTPAGACDLCGQPIKSAEEASLVFVRDGDPLVGHDRCIQRFPVRVHYEIGLARIRERGSCAHPYAVQESLAAWQAHLRQKAWFLSYWEQDLTRAHRIARSLKPRAVRRNRPKVPPRMRAVVFERDGFRCRRCGTGPDHTQLVIDHVVPLARGGRTRVANLQTLCWDCNSGKRDHAPHAHDERGLPVEVAP